MTRHQLTKLIKKHHDLQLKAGEIEEIIANAAREITGMKEELWCHYQMSDGLVISYPSGDNYDLNMNVEEFFNRYWRTKSNPLD